MSQPSGNIRCTATCYTIGLIAGAIAAIMLVLLGSFSWPGAIFSGVVLALVIGLFLGWTVCRPLPTFDEVRSRHDLSATAPRAHAAGTTTRVTPAPTVSATESGAAGAASGGTSAPPASDHSAGAESAPTASADPAPASGTTSDAPATGGVVQPSRELPGQTALEGERGDWKYEAGATSAPAAGSPAPTDADKPSLLSAPHEGGADDLKRIKGVGPRLEQMLNELGVYHFSQIAAWNDREVAWIDDHLESFRGRASRDEWVAQAKILVTGAETEFSKRVGSGDVQ